MTLARVEFHGLPVRLPPVGTLIAAYADCTERGIPIVQAPAEMNFGLTFVVCDPDGHRLRLYASKAG